MSIIGRGIYLPGSEGGEIRRWMRRKTKLLFPIGETFLGKEEWSHRGFESDHVNFTAPDDEQGAPQLLPGLVIHNLRSERPRDR